MIKCGQRSNLLHPFMLVLAYGFIKKIEDIIDDNYKVGKYFKQILYCFSRFFFGLITFLYTDYKKKVVKGYSFMGIDAKELYKNKTKTDGKFKTCVLLFFASYFDFIVSSIRTFYIKGDAIIKSIKSRLRCTHIFLVGILCYFTIRIELNRHHIFSLIILFICCMIIIINEIIYIENKTVRKNYYPMALTIASNIARTFLDTTEKYLFEFNEINMFLVIMVEGIINVISFIIYFLAEGSPTQFEDSKYIKPFENRESLNFFILILLLILYFLFSGLRNIYRVTTIKIYSPVVRALTEAIFDPFLIGSSLFDYKNTSFYWINMVCLVIMVFASLVFTEFIVLYCCGLEFYTHIEISRRAGENNFDDSQSASDIDNDDRLSWISKLKPEERGSEMAIRKSTN
jgi:hypothetical protein